MIAGGLVVLIESGLIDQLQKTRLGQSVAPSSRTLSHSLEIERRMK
jgi:hypothetical protein